ncbi:MAG: hypothetical protein A3C38_02025 [Planctomycetes bacterium RIFCSPHIGHO2_02_FULL_50_42]|nr:MAG: hypothetical protein A3C38_02025 [Planctomycetes bacterium RIFCSPHIGHO2_02_FULL_50_42]OHB91913.1 MAG: hypothetical protein A3E75_01370 [Planctomycetes bacterium RIFCSPHIGHO2_12_FULL_51_37]OHB96236.1 MAG: hypothetical protein A3I59_03460 [Planctomycetes bacterium RIFCSPLOWO2_02_FULL_50_16]OHC05094.1 MAG: hypothetical protein A3G17_09340 [Planctomycetes bacterium RIFCSPLOWO2_12_FULL_50_35]
MARPTDPIRDHHKALEEQVHGFFNNIENLQKFSAEEKQQLQDLIKFLKEELLPHAEGEEKYLYKKVGQLMNNPLFTKTMELDHQHIKRYISELEAEIKDVYKEAADVTIKKIQKAANKLQGLMMPHFQKENDVYLPILDEKLSAEQVYLEIIRPMHGKGGHGGPAQAHGHGHEGHGHGHEGHGHGHGHGHEGHGHGHKH